MKETIVKNFDDQSGQAGPMLTLRCPSGRPSLADAARELGMDAGDLDPKFGVVLIDPEEHLFCVQAKHHDARREVGTNGPFANVRIAPFGRPST